jgi:hypothetical protein
VNKMGEASTEYPVGRRGDRAPCSAGTASTRLLRMPRVCTLPKAPRTLRQGEEGEIRRSPQAVACRKRGVAALGKPQTFLPWKTSVYGIQLLRHRRGNPDTEQCWSLRTAVAHAQAGGGGLSQGKPTAGGGGVLSRRGLGGGESPRQGEGRDGSTQPAQATSAGHRWTGTTEANLPAGDSQQSRVFACKLCFAPRKRVQPKNRMRENCTSGTVRGVPGNRHSYRRGNRRKK